VPNCDDCNLLNMLGDIIVDDEDAEWLIQYAKECMAYNKRIREENLKKIIKQIEKADLSVLEWD